MKPTPRIMLFLLIAVLPITLMAQNPTIILAYMKVTPGHITEYLEVEQAWKKVHQKAVELGVHNGWQLWRNVHAGMNDPYQYITIQWYDNYEHTFGLDAPEGWMADVFSDAEWDALMKKTISSRVYAHQEVASQVTTVDNPGQLKYIIVSRMKVKPGMAGEYEKMEKEIFKPYFEEMIRRGHRSHWGIWNTWPFKEGETRYTAVNGFLDAKQLAAPGVILTPEEVGLSITMDEVREVVNKTRDMVSTEVWELEEYVFPEE